MEEIILPLDGKEVQEGIGERVAEINMRRILSVSRRTIKGYVEKGILPKPIYIKGGKYCFSAEAVIEALGIKDLDELLISTNEAAKILNISILRLAYFGRIGMFTIIRLKGIETSQLWFIKREIDEFDIIIESITRRRAIESEKSKGQRKEMKLFRILFSEKSIRILNLILEDRDADVLRKIYLDKMTYEEIAKIYGVTRERIRQIFEKALDRLDHRMEAIIPLIIKMEERAVKKRMEKKYEDKFLELERRIAYANSVIEKAEDKIIIPENLREIIVPDDFYKHLERGTRLLLKTKIIDCDLPIRVKNSLIRANLETIEDVVTFEYKKFIGFRNFGNKCLMDLKEFLESKGLNFEMDLSSY